MIRLTFSSPAPVRTAARALPSKTFSRERPPASTFRPNSVPRSSTACDAEAITRPSAPGGTLARSLPRWQKIRSWEISSRSAGPSTIRTTRRASRVSCAPSGGPAVRRHELPLRRMGLVVPLPPDPFQLEDHGEAAFEPHLGVGGRRDRGLPRPTRPEPPTHPRRQESGGGDRGREDHHPPAGGTPGGETLHASDDRLVAVLPGERLAGAPAELILELQPTRLHRLHELQHPEHPDLVHERLLERPVLGGAWP